MSEGPPREPAVMLVGQPTLLGEAIHNLIKNWRLNV